MDEKDRRILDVLEQHAEYTTREIARRARIPITTVHHRIKKLCEQGIIKRYTVDLDYQQLGKGLAVLILVSVDYRLLRELKKDQHQLAKELKALPEIEQVHVVTGTTDMVVKARVKDVAAYDQFLLRHFQKIRGIDRTQSLVVIHEA